MAMKKHLTKQEEFDIMKLVLDKFLWLGVAIMAYGFYKIVASMDFLYGLAILLGGAVILVIFMVILIREYEFIKS